MLKNATLAHAIGCVLATSAFGAIESHAQEQDRAAANAESLESVVVAGSRIRHDTYSSAQPVDVVVPETAAVQTPFRARSNT